MRLFLLTLTFLLQNPAQPAQGVGANQSNDRMTDPTQAVSVSSRPSQSADKEEYDPLKDRLYRWYLRATIIGVVGGFIGIVVLIWQAILTRRTADAALTNTEVIIAAERAWIDIDLSKAGILHRFMVVNYGKSLAVITGYTLITAQMTQEEYANLPRKLEEAEDEWGARQVENMYNILLPNKPVELQRIDASSFESSSPDKIAVLCARVEYESIGGPYATEVIYLVKHNLMNIDTDLVNVPGLTNYT
ncbi:MAG TPA: hypothetical protein VN950_01305 [Terriglobales bacterium]|nr:hypothetical protein [Terriglobales bacterium]